MVISGKGGTGKTSITASFAVLSANSVVADCDVDAADLFLVLNPEMITSGKFVSGKEAHIVGEKCVSCGKCFYLCRFDAVRFDDLTGKYEIYDTSCEGCGVCVAFCPAKAIDFTERECGEWFISKTRRGTMVHARLKIGAENSGKLVSLVRKIAREEGVKEKAEVIIVDGPPGIGCPVIASVTGSDAVFAVTEPSLSGKHDLERVSELVRHFNLPLFVCVNKWDINPEITLEIEKFCVKKGIFFCGKIPYDKNVTKAQIEGKSVVEFDKSPAAREISKIWENLCAKIL